MQPHLKTEIEVSQQLWADPETPAGKQIWVIPVCVKAEDSKPFCQIVSLPAQTLPVAGCSAWVFANANASGYYRTQYDSASLQRVSAVATTELTTAERIALLNDEAALLGSGRENIGRYLDLVASLNQDAERAVAESYMPQLRSIEGHLVTESNQAAFRAWVRATFAPMFAKAGWTPVPEERADAHLLRSDLIALLGGIGEAPEVMHRSVELARAYLKDARAMDPSIAADVLQVAARSNDPSLFAGYMAALRDPAATPEVRSNIAEAMAHFTDPKLVIRWLEITVAPETRNQDTAGYISGALRNVAVQTVAWQWIKDHWPQIESKLTAGSGAAIVGATGNFCSAELRDDAQTFFSEHAVFSAKRTLKQAGERINACIDYKERQQTNLNAWLAQHPETAALRRH